MCNILGNSNEDRHRGLTLIELDEKDNKKNTNKVLKGIKDVFSIAGLSFLEESVDGSDYHLTYTQDQDDLVVYVGATYDSDHSYIRIWAYYGKMPKNKRKKVAELINLMNMATTVSRLVIHHDGNVIMESGMHLSKYLETQALLRNLNIFLSTGSFYLLALNELLSSNATPLDIMNYLDKKCEEYRERTEKALVTN